MKNKGLVLLLGMIMLGMGSVACSGGAVTPDEITVPFVEVEPENIPKNVKIYAARLMEYGEEFDLDADKIVQVEEEQIINEKTYIMATLVEDGTDSDEIAKERFAFDLETGDVYAYDMQSDSMTLLFNILKD